MVRSVTLTPGMVTTCESCGSVVRIPEVVERTCERETPPERVSLWRRWLGNLTADTERRQSAR